MGMKDRGILHLQNICNIDGVKLLAFYQIFKFINDLFQGKKVKRQKGNEIMKSYTTIF